MIFLRINTVGPGDVSVQTFGHHCFKINDSLQNIAVVNGGTTSFRFDAELPGALFTIMN